MQNQMNKSFAYAAESCDPASCNTSASDAYFAKTLTAIITMMAVVLFAAVRHIIALDILISIITGVIILVIVRGEAKPVSRT